MIINLLPRFKRSYKKLSTNIQDDFVKKIRIFKQSPRNISLKTHKLNGSLQECWAFSLMDGFRVLFEFVENNEVNLIDIGPHDKYRKWNKV